VNRTHIVTLNDSSLPDTAPSGHNETVTLIVGLVVRSDGSATKNPFCERALSAIMAFVAAGGGHTVARARGTQSLDISAVLDDLEVAGARGFVFVEPEPNRERGEVLTILRRGKPAIWVTPRPALLGIPTVSFDNDYAGYLAALHLIETGCPLVVFPYPADVLTDAVLREEFSWLVARLAGAERACARNGGKFIPVPLATTMHHSPADPRDLWTGMGRAAGEQVAFWVNSPGRAGIIAPNDWFALGIRMALSARGFPAGPPARTPRHYSLIGFDNLPESAEAGLSSIEPPFETLGQRAADLILSLLRVQEASGDATVSVESKMPPSITIRPTLRPRMTTRGKR
jgi:DNA-binding LacI/PurR family transcriptional regulator